MFPLQYLTELTLIDHSFARYPPSLVACAAVCLALHTLGQNAWVSTAVMCDRALVHGQSACACVLALFIALHEILC